MTDRESEVKIPTISVDIDAAELAVRICEAANGMKRPCPDAVDALAAMGAESSDGWQRAAEAALNYIMNECFRHVLLVPYDH